MTKKNQSAFDKEKQQLSTIAAEIERQLHLLNSIPQYHGSDITEQALEYARETSRQNLQASLNEPYFGRLDFQEDLKPKLEEYYIGKIGISDEQTGEVLIVDWRAPVASMFYSFAGSDDIASYIAPEGLIEGIVYLKRNIAIRNKELGRVVDTYVKGQSNFSGSDEFLVYKLSEQKDNRLQDIVSTIQAEQNTIIRSQINLPLIIQGVAGSGKTTVALHRLAYLLYQYQHNTKAEKMIIFAPNNMFLDYISNVLPELGVGHIQQTTFTDWALNMLNQDVQLIDATKSFSIWFTLHDLRPAINENTPGRFKGSVRFLNKIQHCLQFYEKNVIPNKDFTGLEHSLLNAETIKQWFYEEYITYPLVKRTERTISRIKRWIETELQHIADKNVRAKLKRKATQALRTYTKSWNIQTPLSFYKQIFNQKHVNYMRANIFEDIPDEICNTTTKLLNKKLVEVEDLAPIVYIHNYFNGIEKEKRYHHVVLDEAQDFSPFQVAVLQEMTRKNAFTILGDLSQGIHSYQGLNDWQEIFQLFGEESKQGYFELNKSYRSTMEIIQFANKIKANSSQPVNDAVPVFRSGDKVELINTTPSNRVQEITNIIQKYKEDKAKSIAIVGRTEEDCDHLYKKLKIYIKEITLITTKQNEFKGGISIIPIYLTKGLEFDAVLITDVDEINYGLNDVDAKLLYVGCTRALHKLSIQYTKTKSPLLGD
ncbi:HelD family protein [Cytobacillus sp. IB215665]|uniref:HelD family protein n=1 Tax=Cytobacillus sp. IB215665 TaxID=3097357 RepID=UPI002A0AF7C1|nr:UvrD-helicase domain-containing protein [Cytobacillus sp. IB215665]MDX8366184.1 AAA family ATPase [Cytobacillus sp. IB215665]